ncbi:hypothetical protein M122_2594, partial [Bacteroides fragilis str. 3976T7]
EPIYSKSFFVLSKFSFVRKVLKMNFISFYIYICIVASIRKT